MRASTGLPRILLVDGVLPCAIAALLLVAALTMQRVDALKQTFELHATMDTQRLATQLAGSAPAQRAALLHAALGEPRDTPVLRMELQQHDGRVVGSGMPTGAMADTVAAPTIAQVPGAGDATSQLRVYVDRRPLQRALRRTIIAGIGVGCGLLLLAALSRWTLMLHVVRPWRAASEALDAIIGNAATRPSDADHDGPEYMAESIARLRGDIERLRTNAITWRNDSTIQALSRLQQAQVAVRNKSLFLASVGHHFRQPLQALHLFIASLLADAGDKQRHALEQMRGGIDAMTRLLDALLEISRLEAGVVETHAQWFAASELFDRERTLLHAPSMQRGVQLYWHGGQRLLCSDRELVARMLHELVSNAVAHAAPGRVLVAARPHADGVRIEVRDNGPGIASIHQRRIFEDFVQLPDGSAGAPGGYGLGLAIAARIATVLGSRIELRSEPGRGSTFAVVVPRLQERIEPAPETVRTSNG